MKTRNGNRERWCWQVRKPKNALSPPQLLRIVRPMSVSVDITRLGLFGYQRARQCQFVLIEAMHRGL